MQQSFTDALVCQSLIAITTRRSEIMAVNSDRSVVCVCLSVRMSGQQLSNEITFDLDI